MILTVLAEGQIQSCVRALSSPAYEINGQGSHALGSYLHEDGSPARFLDHTQVAQVCQAELQVAVINNSQWCAPVFGMCSTSCSGGCFSHLCCVGEWQCPVLRRQQPRPVLRADRVRRSETVGGGSFLHLCFVREWQPPVLRVEHTRPVLRADRSEHSRRHSNLGARLRQAFGNVVGGWSLLSPYTFIRAHC